MKNKKQQISKDNKKNVFLMSAYVTVLEDQLRKVEKLNNKADGLWKQMQR